MRLLPPEAVPDPASAPLVPDETAVGFPEPGPVAAAAPVPPTGPSPTVEVAPGPGACAFPEFARRAWRSDRRGPRQSRNAAGLAETVEDNSSAAACGVPAQAAPATPTSAATRRNPLPQVPSSAAATGVAPAPVSTSDRAAFLATRPLTEGKTSLHNADFGELPPQFLPPRVVSACISTVSRCCSTTPRSAPDLADFVRCPLTRDTIEVCLMAPCRLSDDRVLAPRAACGNGRLPVVLLPLATVSATADGSSCAVVECFEEGAKTVPCATAASGVSTVVGTFRAEWLQSRNSLGFTAPDAEGSPLTEGDAMVGQFGEGCCRVVGFGLRLLELPTTQSCAISFEYCPTVSSMKWTIKYGKRNATVNTQAPECLVLASFRMERKMELG